MAKCVCGGFAVIEAEPCYCVTCSICGARAHGGCGVWACLTEDASVHVCRGKCWRKYEASKREQETEALWLAMFGWATGRAS